MANQPDSPKPEKSFSVIDFLASVKLSTILLLLVAVLATVGTLIPQGPPSHEMIEQWGGGRVNFLSALGLLDVFHSWWFLAVLAALGLNLSVCTLKRFPPLWKLVTAKGAGFIPGRFEKLAQASKFEVDLPEMDPARAESLVTKAVGRTFRRVEVKSDSGGFTFYAESGRWTRLGYMVVHVGFLLVLAGGMAGSIWGWTGHMNVPEGGSNNVVERERKGDSVELPFSLRCDKFSITYYKDEHGHDETPSEYKSNVTVLENGKPVHTADIIVNSPLTYRGLTFYQSNYGKAPPEKVDMVFTDAASDVSVTVSAPMHKRMALPMGQGEFEVTYFESNFSQMGMDLGPIFVAELHRPGKKPEEVLIPANYPGFDKMRKDTVIISAGKYESGYFTGLQVTRDPGVPLVYAGFLFIIAGLVAAFFLSHRQLYGRISSRPRGGMKLTITGTSTKNPYGLQSRLRIVARRVETGSGES
ncbi:MAG: cytochrome c biogenesis protein ResB [Deltaproteobacteria bacterium]|nr:cytochrome c biogenesis protein ResB [Deltaproteobacteria bacterium]